MLTSALVLVASAALHAALGRLTGTFSQGIWAQGSERGSCKASRGPASRSSACIFYHSKISESQPKSKVWGNGLSPSLLEEVVILQRDLSTKIGTGVAIFANPLSLNQSCATTQWRVTVTGDNSHLKGHPSDYIQAKSPL